MTPALNHSSLGATAAIGLSLLIGLSACTSEKRQGSDPSAQGSANQGAASAPTGAAATSGEATLPVPLPVAFPVPVSVRGRDQRDAYINSSHILEIIGGIMLIGRDPVTGAVGSITVSNIPANGAITSAVKHGAGGALIAARPNTQWTAQAIELLSQGKSAESVVKELVESPENLDSGRMLAVLDNEGRTSVFLGTRAMTDSTRARSHALERENCIVLVHRIGEEWPIVRTVADRFEATEGYPLPERLLVSMRAALEVPSATPDPEDQRFWNYPACSAALQVSREGSGYDLRSDRMVDLRVDLSKDPLDRLERTYKAWCDAVLVGRLPDIIKGLDTRSPAYKPTQTWLRRMRGGADLCDG